MTFLYQLNFHLVILALFAGASLADFCYTEKPVNKNDCDKAIASIRYLNTPYDVLDGDSNGFTKFFGSCMIIVYNPSRVPATKRVIDTGFADIATNCGHNGGFTYVQTFEGEFLHLRIQNIPSGPNTEVYSPGKTTCGRNTNAPMTKSSDCQRAYESIPVDKRGTFLDDKHQSTRAVYKVFRSCVVYIRTNDESTLTATRQGVDPIMKSMIAECRGRSGVHEWDAGTTGLNGMTVIKIRSSKPCGSKKDPKMQGCS